MPLAYADSTPLVNGLKKNHLQFPSHHEKDREKMVFYSVVRQRSSEGEAKREGRKMINRSLMERMDHMMLHDVIEKGF